MRQTIIFVFAHQDDEIGVFPIIQKAVADNLRVVCLYLTSGADSVSGKSIIRQQESSKVLSLLGVEIKDIHFIGSKNEICDGNLIYNLGLSFRSLIKILHKYENISNVYVHAYEGGHHDHDAAFVVVACCLEALSIGNIGKQFPMYRSSRTSMFPYVINKTLNENGAVTKVKYSRLRCLKYCLLTLNYRSQWKSMLGLIPFYAWSWSISATVKIQPVNSLRILSRPHSGKLLYEKHNRMNYEEFKACVLLFSERENYNFLQKLF